MAQKQLEGCLHADILDKDFKLINSWDSKLINSWDALCVTEANKKSLLRFVCTRPRDWDRKFPASQVFTRVILIISLSH